jgi:hypothetical protein
MMPPMTVGATALMILPHMLDTPLAFVGFFIFIGLWMA